MTVSINGSGTMAGLAVGGLNDNIITPAELSTGAPSWDSSGNLSFNSGYGSVATAYACRAWVNFNGTGTVAIRASGNVSSITDNSAGNYTINFATALVDGNYSAVGTASRKSGVQSDGILCIDWNTVPSTTAVRINTIATDNTSFDNTYVNVSIFR